MNTFVKATETEQQYGKTFNGADSFTTTQSRVLDLFKAVGQRGADLSKEFVLAYNENPNLALRVLLWTRDIRGGAGEREVTRNILRGMQETHLNELLAIIPYLPEYGRWDDLLIFTNPIAKKKAFETIKAALAAGNGLCAKWLPRKGAVANDLRLFLELTPKRYRKLLVNLTKVVETQMCAKQWDQIVYDHVPSLAAARYQKAFFKHDPEGYKAYRDGLTKVDPETGKTERKINASAVYPYDIVKSYHRGDKVVADAQWDALPNFLGETTILPMIDLSGSMSGWDFYAQRTAIKSNVTPMHIAISLGLYVAGKQTGPFAGMWLNFSDVPKLRKFNGKLSLSNMYNQLNFSDWGGNTNINAAFDLILETAVQNNVPAKDMPEILLIASDMEFDRCVLTGYSRERMTIFDNAKRKFEFAGYRLPKVVFWNINARADNNPVQMHESGTALVSGFSPALFKAVLANDLKDFTPYNVMLKTLMVDRYTISGVTNPLDLAA